jgi:hypothetical protein
MAPPTITTSKFRSDPLTTSPWLTIEPRQIAEARAEGNPPPSRESTDRP